MRIDNQPLHPPIQVADRFAAAWESGQPVSIESLIESETRLQPQRPEQQRALLIALVQREIDLRQRIGQHPTAMEYAARFPEIELSLLEELVRLPSPPPTQVRPRLPDRYQVLDEIGRGGIGCIWRVLDTRLQRPLAVKVLNRHYRNHPGAEARLRREAMLAGSVQHPGVPPIHELGTTEDGASFFSMKLVDGDTLAQRLGQRDGKSRDLGTLIPIYEQVAQTIAYSHSRQIIHRDLKPANIMVGRFGEVQVMDWGLAKKIDTGNSNLDPGDAPRPGDDLPPASSGIQQATVTDAGDSSLVDSEHELSRIGDVVGTPAYMAPEQARGELATVGTASDVFGLGAILFEILTGRRLYSGQSEQSPVQMAAACQLDPDLDTLANCGADADLIALCRRCLAREPAQRPADAEHVSSAIQHYLVGVQDRLQKSELDRHASDVRVAEERKRRKTLIRVGLVVGLLTLIGIGAVVSQWRRAVDSELQAVNLNEKSRASEQRAIAAQQLALSRLKQTRKTVDDYFTTIARHRGMLNRAPGTLALRQLLLEKAKDYYESFLAENEEDQSLRVEMANAYSRLGTIIADLKPGSDEANIWFEKSIEVADSIVPNDEFSALDIIKLKADNYGRIGYQYLSSDRFQPAIEAFEMALAPAIEIAAANPDMANRKAVAMHLHNLGMCKSDLNQPDAALDYFLRAVAIGDDLVEQFPDDSDLLVQASRMHNNLGTLYGFNLDQKANALTECETALDFARRGLAIDPEIPEYQNNVASALNNVALMLHFNGRVDDSLNAFVETATIRETIVENNPDQPRFGETLTQTYSNLGTLFVMADQTDKAIEYYEKSVALNLKISDANPQMVRYRISGFDVLNSLTSLYLEQGNRQAGEVTLQKLRQMVDKLIAVQPASQRWPLVAAELALLLPEASRPDLAGLLDTIEEKFDAKRFHTVQGLADFRQHRFQDAIEDLNQVPEEDRGETWFSLSAMCRWKLGQEESAAQHLETATEMIGSKQHPQAQAQFLYAEAKQMIHPDLD